MNKKIIVGIVIALFSGFFYINRTQTMYGDFTQQDLFAVMTLTNVSTQETSLAAVVKNTQAAWLRKPGTERWEVEKVYEDKRNELLPLFEQMHLVNAIIASALTYKYALFLGATVASMIIRMQTLLDLLASGVQVEEIVVLVGQRQLTDFEKEEAKKRWNVEIQTETDAARYIFKDHHVTQKITFIDAPQKLNAQGILCRPTTEDTVKGWLQLNPTPGSIVAISSQPVCNYQKMVLRTMLPKEFTVEAIGIQAPAQTAVAVYLDTITRTLYQLFSSSKK